ncbi:hypothetical protein ACFWZJ_22325 [Streptomyces massasporeus]
MPVDEPGASGEIGRAGLSTVIVGRAVKVTEPSIVSAAHGSADLPYDAGVVDVGGAHGERTACAMSTPFPCRPPLTTNDCGVVAETSVIGPTVMRDDLGDED